MKIINILVFISLLFVSTQAFSHSKLIASTPAKDAQLSISPEQVELEFNREVRLLKLEVQQVDADKIDISFKPTMDKSTTFAVVVPTLSPAGYQVNWLAMGGDSHKMKGSFDFVVSDAASKSVNQPESDTGSKAVVSALIKATPAEHRVNQQSPASVANAFAMALSHGDGELLKRVASPEIIIYEEGGIEQSFAEYAAGHMKSDIAYMSKVERTIKSQQVVKDTNLATVITHAELRNKSGSGSRSMLETMVLKHAEDGWRIAHIHWSSQQM